MSEKKEKLAAQTKPLPIPVNNPLRIPALSAGFKEDLKFSSSLFWVLNVFTVLIALMTSSARPADPEYAFNSFSFNLICILLRKAVLQEITGRIAKMAIDNFHP